MPNVSTELKYEAMATAGRLRTVGEEARECAGTRSCRLFA